MSSPLQIGLSRCCDAHPYSVNGGGWRCGRCFDWCETYVPQRQDSLDDQLRDVIKIAERYMGCYDAADFIKSAAALNQPGPTGADDRREPR